MKDNIFHESSQSDENNEVIKKRSGSGVPVSLFNNPSGKLS